MAKKNSTFKIQPPVQMQTITPIDEIETSAKPQPKAKAKAKAKAPVKRERRLSSAITHAVLEANTGTDWATYKIDDETVASIELAIALIGVRSCLLKHRFSGFWVRHWISKDGHVHHAEENLYFSKDRVAAHVYTGEGEDAVIVELCDQLNERLTPTIERLRDSKFIIEVRQL